MSISKRDLKFAVLGGLISTATASVTAYVLFKKQAEAYEAQLAKELQDSIDFLVETQILPNQTKVVSDEEFDEIERDDVTYAELDEVPDDALRVFTSEEEKPPLAELGVNQKTQYNKILTDAEYDTALLDEEPPYEDPDISVISKDIFDENGSEWEQSSFTYFADGGVLDEQGDFVEDPQELIGTQTPPFGDMSGDPQIVYLRNKRVEREFEVISDSGNASDFASSMDGDDSLQHSLQMLQEKYKHEHRR